MNFQVGKIQNQVNVLRTASLGEWREQSGALGGSIQASIGGKTEVFRSVDAKFDALVAEWRRLRERGSSTDDLINDAYGQIVGMGWDAVPLLLREVERQSGNWFPALKWITGLTIGDANAKGNIRELRKAWILWGVENGQSGRLVSRGKLAEIVSSTPSA